ncbi:MAG: hypothetical protein QHH04_01090 [Methanolinea sp.]|nr:hypothetical protein [Methanolinea sp.]
MDPAGIPQECSWRECRRDNKEVDFTLYKYFLLSSSKPIIKIGV